MATLTITVPANSTNGGAGEVLRKLADNIRAAAINLPDKSPTGASTVLTIDNGPAVGIVSVQITGGPIQSGVFIA